MTLLSDSSYSTTSCLRKRDFVAQSAKRHLETNFYPSEGMDNACFNGIFAFSNSSNSSSHCMTRTEVLSASITIHSSQSTVLHSTKACFVWENEWLLHYRHMFSRYLEVQLWFFRPLVGQDLLSMIQCFCFEARKVFSIELIYCFRRTSFTAFFLITCCQGFEDLKINDPRCVHFFHKSSIFMILILSMTWRFSERRWMPSQSFQCQIHLHRNCLCSLDQAK